MIEMMFSIPRRKKVDETAKKLQRSLPVRVNEIEPYTNRLLEG